MTDEYLESWFNSDFQSYLLYLDGYISKTKSNEESSNKPMNFEEFRQSITA